MADFPALPLWTDAYLADTRHLTTEEHGAYLLLMMEAWRRPECNLPDDDLILARLTGLSSDRWATVKPVVMAFWKRDGRRKTWTQKRLSSERSYVAQKSASQREKAAKRWNKTDNEHAVAMPNGCPEDAPTPTPTEEKRETNVSLQKKGSRLASDWQLPPDWAAWAVAEGLDEAAVRTEGEKFGDYWRATPGQKGVKLDWQATWRVWVRKAIEDRRHRTRVRSNGAHQIGEQRRDRDGRTWEYGGAVDGWVEVRG